MPSVLYSDRALFKWLWKNYLKKYLFLLILALTFMIIEGSMTGALSYMLKPMFDVAFATGDKNQIWIIGVLFFVIFCTRGLSSLTQRLLINIIAEKTIADIQKDLYRHLIALDNHFHHDNSPGALLSRIQNDVNSITQIWNTIIVGAGRDFITLLSLIAVAFWIDALWTLITLTGIPLLVLPVFVTQRFIRRYAARMQDLYAKLTNWLDESFHAITTIKLNQLEKSQFIHFSALTKERVRASIKANFGSAMIPCMFDIVAGIGFFLAILYGGIEIIAGDKTIGDFMAFFAAIGFAFQPLRNITNVFGQWQKAAAGIERIKYLFDIKPTLTSPTIPQPLPVANAPICFEKVSFSVHDKTIISNASFTIEPGQATAFVGSSGAGKSSIFKLITRLFDVSSGHITYGGHDIKNLDLNAYRGQFSSVAQDVAIFDGTLRTNLILDKHDIDENMLQKVLSITYVDRFFPKLQAGFETELGPRGVKLSGGQCQRIAIARALLRERPILLMDEATSALDTPTESKIFTNLAKLRKGSTTLIITHRLSTIRNADKIIVMDAGRVAGVGTHQELLAKNNVYKMLHHIQEQQNH